MVCVFPAPYRALTAIALASLLAFPPTTHAEPRAGQKRPNTPCRLEPGPTRAVVRIIDAETLLLDDGRQVRLIGALAPRSPDMSPDAEAWAPEEEAETTLRALVLGRTVELAYAGRRRDRYGHLLAHLFFADRQGKRVWVQGRLLSRGHARAYGLPDSFACMPELMAHERVARAAQSGLWASAAYATRQASRSRALLRARNTYQIVVGKVTRVKSTRTRTYLDFGKEWRTDFSAGIDAKILRANPEWAKSIAQLQDQRVEVRGWIEYRYGPFIKIEDPSQIAAAKDVLHAPKPPARGPTTSSGRRTSPRQKQKRPEQKPPGALDL